MKKINKKYKLLTFVLIYLTSILISDYKIIIGKTPVYYYADSLIFNDNELGPIRDYYGNVRLIQGDVKIYCDFAKYYLKENKSELSGNVILQQNYMKMYSKYAKYDGNTKVSNAWGDVKILQNNTKLTASEGIYYTENQYAVFKNKVYVEDDTLKLYSNSLNYYKSVKDIEAYGNVFLFGKLDNAILNADTLIRSKKDGYTKANGNSILYKIDTNKTDPYKLKFDTTKISSDYIYVIENDSSQVYNFIGNVVINTNEITAKADTTYFDKFNGIIKLLHNPIVWYGENQLYGDSIVIYLNDNKLSKIFSNGNALTVAVEDSVNKSFVNQLSGNNIEFSFKTIDKKNTLDYIISDGNAKSLYFLGENQGIADAKLNTCNKIKVIFEDGKPDKVYWIDDIEGNIYPYDLIKGNIKEYYLQNFRWNDNKPVSNKINFDLLIGR